MFVVRYWSARSCDLLPGTHRQLHVVGQRPITEQHPKGRSPRHQCGRTLPLGNLDTQVLTHQLAGARIQLGQLSDVMCLTRPLHKADTMFLVGATCLKRMDLLIRDRPGLALLTNGLFCGITTLPDRHFTFQAIDGLFHDTFTVCAHLRLLSQPLQKFLCLVLPERTSHCSDLYRESEEFPGERVVAPSHPPTAEVSKQVPGRRWMLASHRSEHPLSCIWLAALL